jgi:hypothetical protein
MKIYGIYESFHNLVEKGAKSEPKGPKGAKSETKGVKSEPKGSQGEPKVKHLEAQGCQK